MKLWIIVLLVLIIAGISYIILSHIYDFIDNISSTIKGSYYTFSNFNDAVDAYISCMKSKPVILYESCVPIYWHDSIKKHKLKTMKMDINMKDIQNKNYIFIECDGCTKETNMYSNRNKNIIPALSDITHCSTTPIGGKSYIYKTNSGTVLYITDMKLRTEFMQKEITGDGLKLDKENPKLPAYEAFVSNDIEIPSSCRKHFSKLDNVIMWNVDDDIDEKCMSLIKEI